MDDASRCFRISSSPIQNMCSCSLSVVHSLIVQQYSSSSFNMNSCDFHLCRSECSQSCTSQCFVGASSVPAPVLIVQHHHLDVPTSVETRCASPRSQRPSLDSSTQQQQHVHLIILTSCCFTHGLALFKRDALPISKKRMSQTTTPPILILILNPLFPSHLHCSRLPAAVSPFSLPPSHISSTCSSLHPPNPPMCTPIVKMMFSIIVLKWL